MPRVKLSKRYCDGAGYSGSSGRPDIRWDEGTRGFGLRVYPSGRKAWLIFYRTPERRQRWHVLGDYEHLTLEQARALARAELGRVCGQKADPQEERRRARLGETVEDLVDLYLAEWARPRKRTAAEDERQLEKDVVPVLGSRRLTEVTRRDVQALLDQVAARGPVAANRLLAVLRKMFGFALDRELLEHSPCERLRAYSTARPKDRVLSPDEIRVVWAALSPPLPRSRASDPAGAMSASMRRALRFVLVTGQRPGEVAGALWDQVEGSWWTIPAEVSKPGRSHRVPLSPLALEVMGPRKKGPVFPGRVRGQPFGVAALSHAVAQAGRFGLVPWTPHDLRRTAASHMTGMGVARLVVSRILNHAEGGVTAIYDRHSYDREKREALEAWGVRLAEMVQR